MGLLKKAKAIREKAGNEPDSSNPAARKWTTIRHGDPVLDGGLDLSGTVDADDGTMSVNTDDETR